VIVLAVFLFFCTPSQCARHCPCSLIFRPFATVMSVLSLTLSRAGTGQSVAPSYDIML